MTYSASAKGIKIDRARAAAECAKHGLCTEDTALCLSELFGKRATIDASKLMAWLGY